jgi:hypothetical protein
MLLAGLGNMLPTMAISDISAVIYKPQIVSSIVQAIAVYVVTFFALSELPA